MAAKLQLSFLDPIVQLDGQLAGAPTKPFQDYLSTLNRMVPSVSPLVVSDFGAAGNGTRDDTAAFQAAIDQTVANGGGVVLVPPGNYSLLTVTFPAGTAPVTLMGYGASSVLKRRGDLAVGSGMLDILGSNVTLDNFLIDGNVTTPTGLLYNADFMGGGLNDPMADSLTRNTSVWLHPGGRRFTAQRLIWQHTGGYSLLADANGDGGLEDVRVLGCLLRNNRPHLFGVTAGDAIYGSWTGGIYINGGGQTANPGRVLKGVLVAQCRFERNAGNCLWSHVYGLDELHEDFQFTDNYFLDCGLDAILVGGVTGGAVGGNVLRRIGYVTVNDTDRSTPRWLPNLQATGIDSSGVVKGVPYYNNSLTSINGGCMDLDGHGDSAITGNLMRCPAPGEPEYDEDQIAISGPGNNGQASYGVNLGNTSDTPWGGRNVNIVGNQFINLAAGAARLFAARDCHFEGNNIIVPNQPSYPPIAYGCLSTSPNRRSRNNVIRHNRVTYSPAIAAPVVYEDGQYSPFTADDINFVFGNNPITGASGLAFEFQKDVNSGSPTYAPTVWFP